MRNGLSNIGRVLAIALHPVFLFSYVYLALSLTYGHYAFSLVRFSAVVLLSAALPILVAVWVLGLDPLRMTRQQRRAPLLTSLFCTLAILVLLMLLPGENIPAYERAFPFLVGQMAVLAVLFASTFVIKASLHAAGLAWVSIYFLHMWSRNPRWQPFAISAILLLVIVSAQRLHSRAHSPLEVGAGIAIALAGLLGFSAQVI